MHVHTIKLYFGDNLKPTYMWKSWKISKFRRDFCIFLFYLLVFIQHLLHRSFSKKCHNHWGNGAWEVSFSYLFVLLSSSLHASVNPPLLNSDLEPKVNFLLGLEQNFQHQNSSVKIWILYLWKRNYLNYGLELVWVSEYLTTDR